MGLPNEPDRPVTDRLVGHTAAVHGAVELEHAHVEALLERLPDGGRHAAAHHQAHRVVGVVGARRLAVDAVAMPPTSENVVQP